MSLDVPCVGVGTRGEVLCMGARLDNVHARGLFYVYIVVSGGCVCRHNPLGSGSHAHIVRERKEGCERGSLHVVSSSPSKSFAMLGQLQQCI